MIETLDSLFRIATNFLWAIVALYLLIYFRQPIRALLNRFASAKKGQLSIHDKGFEINFEGVVEAAVYQGAAAATVDKATSETELRHIAKTIASAAETGAISHLIGKAVLWVDDEPENNEYGIKSLQAQGLQVIICRSTREALEQLKSRDFNAIITDQLRHEEGIRKDTAGYELLRELQKAGSKVPVILSTAFPNKEEARSLGFYDTTNTQHGVFETVLKAIQHT